MLSSGECSTKCQETSAAATLRNLFLKAPRLTPDSMGIGPRDGNSPAALETTWVTTTTFLPSSFGPGAGTVGSNGWRKYIAIRGSHPARLISPARAMTQGAAARSVLACGRGVFITPSLPLYIE